MESQATGVRPMFSFDPLSPIKSILKEAGDQMEKSMDAIANKVHNAALDIVLKAAEQTRELIESLKVAYEDCMEKTLDRVDESVRKNLKRLEALVGKVISEEQEALLKVTEEIKDIVRLSPLNKAWMPFLSETAPRFAAVGIDPDNPGAPTKVLVRFKGNFPCTGDKDCVPKFIFNKEILEPASSTVNELQFLVSIPSDIPTADMHRYTYLPGKLKLTYDIGWIWKKLVSAEYNTLLSLLPKTPGKIRVLYTKNPELKIQTFRSPVVDVTPNKAHWQHILVSYKPDSGWHVLRGSSSFHWLPGSRGQLSDGILKSDDHDEVIYDYAKKDGAGSFQVVFDESQTIPESERDEDISDLRWGDSRLLIPNNGEKIRAIYFTAFNGTGFQFLPQEDHSNPILDLEEGKEGAMRIKIKNTEIFKDAGVGDISLRLQELGLRNLLMRR